MSRVTEEQLRRLAETTLANNWSGDHTVPSRLLYPHQWSWDTGFTAIGQARVSPDRAWHDLRSLFTAQWADGRVPHIVFDSSNGNADRYFPGPRFWQTDRVRVSPGRPTSGIVQPPIHALAAWEVFQRDRNRTALAALYPRLVAQHRYLTAHRNLGGAGLAAIVHPWESGQDNSPAWDEALAAIPVDLAEVAHHQRRDLAVSNTSHRPTDTDYGRYVAIALQYREGGYADDRPLPFRVECPAFNAILAASEHALAEIAYEIGADPMPHRDRAARLTAVIADRLFDPATGMCHARDLRTDRLSRARCIGGLVPLILPDLPEDRVKSMVEEASTGGFGLGEQMRLPLPSYDRNAPDLDPVRYWRGPIWVNMNWLICRGLRQHGYEPLAAALRRSVIEVVRGSGCYEYFHAITGAGIGTPEFSWTAALTLDLLDA
jgi:hypothetical protein